MPVRQSDVVNTTRTVCRGILRRHVFVFYRPPYPLYHDVVESRLSLSLFRGFGFPVTRIDYAQPLPGVFRAADFFDPVSVYRQRCACLCLMFVRYHGISRHARYPLKVSIRPFRFAKDSFLRRNLSKPIATRNGPSMVWTIKR